MTDPNNSTRAIRALTTLATYDRCDHVNRMASMVLLSDDRAKAQELLEEAVADLLCDTLHLADRVGISLDMLLMAARAITAHNAESTEDDEGPWAVPASVDDPLVSAEMPPTVGS